MSRLSSILLALLLLALAIHQGFSQATSPTYLPLIQKAPSPSPLNGDFEMGPEIWQQESRVGYPLILPAETLQQAGAAVAPHSGQWAAWLGGADNESSRLQQTTFINPATPHLSFWIWTASDDNCAPDRDLFVVTVGDPQSGAREAVFSLVLCTDNNTPGWMEQSADLSLYAGQTVLLTFQVTTNEALNSNLFLDDVLFGEMQAAAGTEATKKPYQAAGLFGNKASVIFSERLPTE